MKRTEISTVGFNTTSDTLLDCDWKATPLEHLQRLVMEGALYTDDKTTILVNDRELVLYGTFDLTLDAFQVKRLKVTAGFGGARVGLLTVFFSGEDERKLASKAVGTGAALPSALNARL